MKKEKALNRIHEIDLIKGICILLMIFDHAFYDLMFFSETWVLKGLQEYQSLYSLAHNYWNSPIREAIHFIVISIFVIVSGISTQFSHNNWLRTLKMGIFALLFTGCSYILCSMIGYGNNIDFNIIHVLTVSLLFYCLFRKRSNKFMLVFAILVFLTTIGISLLKHYNLINLDNDFIRVVLFPLGVISENYACADYLPLLPYLGIFFIGVIMGRKMYKSKESRISFHKWERPFCFIGHYSIWFYISHQAIMMSIFMLICVILNLPLPF